MKKLYIDVLRLMLNYLTISINIIHISKAIEKLFGDLLPLLKH